MRPGQVMLLRPVWYYLLSGGSLATAVWYATADANWYLIATFVIYAWVWFATPRSMASYWQLGYFAGQAAAYKRVSDDLSLPPIQFLPEEPS